jgi:hypothetical protein
MRLACVAAALAMTASAGNAGASRPHHRVHHHRRPAARAHHPLRLSGEMSSDMTASADIHPRRSFADDDTARAFRIQDRLGRGATATLGLQSRAGGPVVDRSEMNSAAASGPQPSSQMVGVAIKRPF